MIIRSFVMGFNRFALCPAPCESNFPVDLSHVTSRGDGRETIFLSEEDWRLFLVVLSEVIQDLNWGWWFVLHSRKRCRG